MAGGTSKPTGCMHQTTVIVSSQILQRNENWGPSGNLAKELGSAELVSDCGTQRAPS